MKYINYAFCAFLAFLFIVAETTTDYTKIIALAVFWSMVDVYHKNSFKSLVSK